MKNIKDLMQNDALVIQASLDTILDPIAMDDEIYRPTQLIETMRYGALNGGKRLRPFLVLQCGQMLGAKRESLIQIASAIECVHCYSLVHDDLPAMDDDDLRRGKPTLHRAFDEASAILAGDGLLTIAFDILSDARTHVDPDIRLQLISGLSKAVGVGGMVGGQMLDLFPETSTDMLGDIARMQAMKTGALIRFSCLAGAIAANSSLKQRDAISKYGELIGQAFQLTDDILDVVSNSATLGKQTTKDANRGKITEVTTLGIGKAKDMVAKLLADACDQVVQFGDRADPLRQIADFILHREK